MARIKKQKRRLYAQGWRPAPKHRWRLAGMHPHYMQNKALEQLECSIEPVRASVVRRRRKHTRRWAYARGWGMPADWCTLGVRALTRLRWPGDARRVVADDMRGFARHVLGASGISDIWLQPFLPGFVGRAGSRLRWARITAMRAAGTGLRAMKRQGLLPAGFTPAMLAHIDASTLPLSWAYRQAMVLGWGGSGDLADAIWHTRLRDLQVDEDQWLTLVGWLIHHGIDSADVRRWVDYLTTHPLDLHALEPSSIWRDVDRWGALHVDPTDINFALFEPSGFGRNPPILKGGMAEEWSFHELLTYQQLADEGDEMRHCVRTYARHVFRGRSAIWSVRRHHDRQLTVEVLCSRRLIAQVRGYKNRSATPVEHQLLTAWASANDLTLDRHP